MTFKNPMLNPNIPADKKERAQQILKQLEGLSISEAQGLLELCKDVLASVKVRLD